jgi:hypothetical protein
MHLDDHFLILKNRVAIRVDALESIFRLKISLYRKLGSEEEGLWEVFVYKIDKKFHEFIFIDSIPRNIRTQFKVPDPLDLLTDEIKELIDPIEKQSARIKRLKLQIDTSFNNYLNSRERGNHYYSYIEQKFDDLKAKAFSRGRGLLEIIDALHGSFNVKEIYTAVIQLAEENQEKYDFIFLLRSNRSFYRYLDGNAKIDYDGILINGLSQKPSNRSIKCKNTIELVKKFLKHINELPDTIITIMVNSIIMAFPNTYNGGRTISRPTVNNIKHRNEVEIKIAREGTNYLDKVVNTIHRFPTQYPLDRVEIDFTKIHGEIKDDRDFKCNKVICKIIDTCTGATLGLSTGNGESFEVFRQAFCEMLNKTNGRLPAEIVVDRSPAIRSGEFERIDIFLRGLLGEDYLTVVKKARGKGSIESHWKTLFELYMPLVVGQVGGNIASSKRHRPKHEIWILLKKAEYMRDDTEWESLVRQMDRQYNDSKVGENELSRIEKFVYMNKPNSVQLTNKHVAYVSWIRRHETFGGLEFEIQSRGMDYFFGWLSSDVITDSQKEFIMKNTGTQFDVYHDPDKMKEVYVFEKDSLTFVDSYKCVRRFYGNKADQRKDPKRRQHLINELENRKALAKDLMNRVQQASDGLDLHSYLQEIQNSTKTEEELLEELAFRVLSTLDRKDIDPFKGEPVERKPMQRVKLKDTIKPTKIKSKMA